jgi:hypothetical protein
MTVLVTGAERCGCRASYLAALFAFLAACGAGVDSPPIVNNGGAVLPTDGHLQVSFSVTIEEQVSGNGVAIRQNVGWVIRPETTDQMPVILYDRVVWDYAGVTIYGGVGLTASELVPVWFYCDGSDWFTVWYESTTDGIMREAFGQGVCSEALTAHDARVQLPSSTLNEINSVGEFTVQGPQLSVNDSGRGRMSLAGKAWDLAVFATVDCTVDCGSPGWYELHSLYWRPTATDMCLGLFYLFPDDPGRVSLEHSMCLPSLSDPEAGVPVAFEASWSLANRQ